jgi:uncharacterized membrane protein YgdD (TMEM256/DUF423 family)
MERTFYMLGALMGFGAVALGAVGAHLLAERFAPGRAETFELAARFHMYHALALIATGWVAARWGAGAVVVAGWAFVLGILLFCGSLYALSLGGPRWVAAITPFGGLAFLAGWLALAWAAFRGGG